MQKKLVIFDFDGVLANTMLLWFSINKKTNPGYTYEHFAKMAYGNSYHAFQSGKYEGFIMNPNSQQEYDEGITFIKADQWVESFIKSLCQKYILAIVSSGSEPTIKDFLDRHDIGNCFSDILGFQTHTSKTEKINALLTKHSISSKNAVFITDSLGDVVEANEAHVKSIGVTWGIHDKETLLRGNPEMIISDANELETAVEKILNRIIEKPSVLYHGSSNKHIQEFEPRPTIFNHTQEGNYVVATPEYLSALPYLFSGYIAGEFIPWAAGDFGREGIHRVIISISKEIFIKNDTGGAVYSLSSETFISNEDRKNYEWISEESVKPIAVELHDSILKTWEENKIRPYFLTDEQFKHYRSLEKGREIGEYLDSLE